MSTRSGKRIHASFHEDTVRAEEEIAVKSERKTRSKRLKENDDQIDVSFSKSKKRNNYVSYPTDDEILSDAAVNDVTEAKPTRRLRRNTLKDHNADPFTEADCNDEDKTSLRFTRRTKKFAEAVDVPEGTENIVEVIPNGKAKGKKNKKKKAKKSGEQLEQNGMPVLKKSKKKKKGRSSGSFTEEIVENNGKIFNKSNTSIDSFHSAASSPQKKTIDINSPKSNMEHMENTNKINTSSEKIANISHVNDTFEKESKKSKSSLKNDTYEKLDVSKSTRSSKVLNSTFDKDDKFETTLRQSINNDETSVDFNTTLKKETRLRKSSLKENFDKSDKINTTFEKNSNSKRSTKDNVTVLNATLENPPIVRTSTRKATGSSEKLNTTFEKEPAGHNSITSLQDAGTPPQTLNNTFDKPKQSKTISLDSTYDKEPKLDTTFDKSDSVKSSLISSDNTVNVTFDKSNDSRISITSDDSKTENIINTTPLLIESSMDTSEISDSTKPVDNSTISPKVVNNSLKPAKSAVTPLKREGTFTKDGPDVIIMSPKPKLSSEKTPTKRTSLPSAGFTPFHVTQSSQKDRSTSVMNITRSLEKSGRRSTLAEVAPRQTRVMFCSPVNNPAVVLQQKKKIIKSSLKGSNKSFVFDDSVSGSSTARPGARKRSFTHNDAEDARVKRKRLADDLQTSVDRLSRPRTTSATAKLTASTTPSKKATTPSKSESKPSRTKLPNFAALHQRRFDKMESLDECQERKKKRAKQLLTPTGKVTVLERSSPRGNTELPKPKEVATKEIKPETPSKPKLPTLESLRPGYTRFGFRMHVDGNPFSIPSKTDNKPKENKPNGLIQALPSRAGATDRKETAKQAVMREKSFTSLSGKRDVKRKENRTIIKGVRTNRRFELQMKLRNIN